MDLLGEVNNLNLVSVAYVGDAVYSLFVRNRLVKRFDYKSGKLHLLSKYYVMASSQAKILDATLDKLTEVEADIVRRAKNSHTPSKAKNASVGDYKKATALEGLIGYLYLLGDSKRLDEVLDFCAFVVENQIIPKGKVVF